MSAPVRAPEWFEGRSPQDQDLRVEVDALGAEQTEVSGKIWNSVVRFSARGITGYASLSGGIAHRAPDGAEPLVITEADTAAVLYALDGARSLANLHEQAAVWYFHGGPEVKIGEPLRPRSTSGGYASPLGRPGSLGASSSGEMKPAESTMNDYEDLKERLGGRLKDAKDAEAWFRRHVERKASYRFTVISKNQYTTASMDGRRCVFDLVLPGDADLARRITWAVRAAEIEAQTWATELVAPLLAKAPTLADFGSDAGPVQFDVTRGIADWPPEDPAYQQTRDLFLGDLRKSLERIEL